MPTGTWSWLPDAGFSVGCGAAGLGQRHADVGERGAAGSGVLDEQVDRIGQQPHGQHQADHQQADGPSPLLVLARRLERGQLVPTAAPRRDSRLLDRLRLGHSCTPLPARTPACSARTRGADRLLGARTPQAQRTSPGSLSRSAQSVGHVTAWQRGERQHRSRAGRPPRRSAPSPSSTASIRSSPSSAQNCSYAAAWSVAAQTAASTASRVPWANMSSAGGRTRSAAVTGSSRRVRGEESTESADHGHRPPGQLLLDQVGSAGQFVGDGPGGDRELVAVRVALPGVVDQHPQAGRADGLVGLAEPPGPAGGVGDDHADPPADQAERAVARSRSALASGSTGSNNTSPGRRWSCRPRRRRASIRSGFG